MKYDITHDDAECGETYVDARLADGHDEGDRVTIVCQRCGRVGEHTVQSRLSGLAAFDVDT